MYNEKDQEVIQNIIQISVLLFVCVRLHLHREPCSEAEGVFEDGCFGEAYVLVPAIVKFFEDLLLLVGEGLFQVLVMPCHIAEQFLHLLGVVSAVLLRNDVSVP